MTQLESNIAIKLSAILLKDYGSLAGACQHFTKIDSRYSYSEHLLDASCQIILDYTACEYTLHIRLEGMGGSSIKIAKVNIGANELSVSVNNEITIWVKNLLHFYFTA